MRFPALLLLLTLLVAPAMAHGQAPPEPPVGVVPMPTGDVTPEIVNAIRDAVVAQLSGIVQGREVRALESPEHLVAILECPDAACIGAKLAELGAIAGVLVRIHREPAAPRARPAPRPVMITIEVVDPVSGAPRVEPVQISLEEEQLAVPADVLSPHVSALAPAMPAAPPRASLLVAVNVDDAAITIDGEEIGRSPVAPVEVAPGRHQVAVTHPGFVSRRQPIDVGRGENARLDILLEVDPQNAELLEADAAPVAGGGGGGAQDGPFYTRWYVIAGAGVVLAAITVAIIVLATSGGDEQTGPTGGIPIPPIE